MKIQIRDDAGQVVMERYFEAGEAQVVCVAAPETESTKAVIEAQGGYLRPTPGLDRHDRILAVAYVAIAFYACVRTAAEASGWGWSAFWLYLALAVALHGRSIWRALR